MTALNAMETMNSMNALTTGAIHWQADRPTGNVPSRVLEVLRVNRSRHLLRRPAAFSDDDEGCPEKRMGVVRFVFVVDQRQHGPTVRLGPTDTRLRRFRQHPRRDRNRRVRADRPVRDQQRPAAGIPGSGHRRRPPATAPTT